MKVFLALVVVLAIVIGAGVKFLVAPVTTAYGVCEDIANQKFSMLMTPVEGADTDEYCTGSRETLDDLTNCIAVAAEINSIAPTIISYQERTTDMMGIAVTNHQEICPSYPVGME